MIIHYNCTISGGSRGGFQGAMEPPFHRLSAATVARLQLARQLIIATPTKNKASIHATRLEICPLGPHNPRLTVNRC